jgi:hypothetical protein
MQVDAIVAEGFEAGGHNGREETTTLTLTLWLKSKLVFCNCCGRYSYGRYVGSDGFRRTVFR